MKKWNAIVRCKQGHLYRTTWWDWGSFKAVRWFNRRFQWCPVDRHWVWVTYTKPEDLSAGDLAVANAHRDSGIL
jgi:hypothetical protein